VVTKRERVEVGATISLSQATLDAVSKLLAEAVKKIETLRVTTLTKISEGTGYGHIINR
jgi:hypothetical protein